MKRILTAAIVLTAFSTIFYAQTGRVITDKANLRGRAADDSKIVEALSKDTKVDLIKVSGLWYLVQSKDFAGWIFTSDLEVEGRPPDIANIKADLPPSKSPAAPSTSRTAPSGDKTYVRGSRGGCYYLSTSGNKVYVARELCG